MPSGTIVMSQSKSAIKKDQTDVCNDHANNFIGKIVEFLSCAILFESWERAARKSLQMMQSQYLAL